MFRFVSDSTGGVGTKRKQSQRSCDTCKKRHKRCSHVLRSPDAADGPSFPPTTQGPQGEGSHASSGSASNLSNIRGIDESRRLSLPGSAGYQLANPQRSDDRYLRFIGDLSPEASFLANRDHGNCHARSSQRADVGVWLGQGTEDSENHESQEVAGTEPTLTTTISSFPSGLKSLQALQPHIRRECMSMLPPEYELRIISELFYAKIDPIFPIIHDERLDQLNNMEAVALKQCICLMAALDPSMRSYLRLPHTESVLSQTEFRKCIAEAVKQSLDMGFIRDNMVILQVCSMMAFHVDKPSCSEVSTYYCAQAVHYSQTLGLHLGWPDENTKRAKSRRIFWCVWVLDRLNAATNGRPVLIHSRDMDEQMLDSIAEQGAPFRLLIRIARFLDETISQYRPQAAPESRIVEEQTFEDIVRETQAMDVGNALLASLELFYLSIAILRSRPWKSGGEIDRSPASNAQTFCAMSIISIATEEFRHSISFWAIVPYAVSLATSVAYQTLRNSSIPYRRKQAYTMFHTSCDILDELSRAFVSARTMAQLAKNTLQEVERVAAGWSRARDGGQEAQSVNHGPTVSGAGHSIGRGHRLQVSSTPDQQTPTEPRETQRLSHHSPYPLPLSGNSFDLDPNVFNDITGTSGVFNDFDASFDLNRIDTVFSANLDPTLPMFPENWVTESQFG
ncbi:hypothetical protein F4780DRAFT_386449 [Xylariomycetidae sp. FL0641]|nr:hypothetical protein F4780DRAFT_386449 [Xylariomycetidae sp. FL0641]